MNNYSFFILHYSFLRPNKEADQFGSRSDPFFALIIKSRAVRPGTGRIPMLSGFGPGL